MAYIAPIENGKVVQTPANSTAKTASEANGMNKDTFLQLLVAQMKYQDPLEPTSNTEYVAQYAQFSQVEQIQNMSASMDLQRASMVVGKEVRVKTTGSSGETEYIEGHVDSVVYENGKAFLSINEKLYSISDLVTVIDDEYYNAANKASAWVIEVNKLPSLNNISLSDKNKLLELASAYDNMSDYEKTFIAGEKLATLRAYIQKINELENAANPENDPEPETEPSPDAEQPTPGTEPGPDAEQPTPNNEQPAPGTEETPTTN